MASAKPLLWFLPGLAILATTHAVSSYRGEPLTALQRLVLRSWLAAAVALGIIAYRGIMRIAARWERALLRWLPVLAAGLNVLPCFVALDYAAVAVALHVFLAWVVSICRELLGS